MRESTLWILHLAAGAVMIAVLGIHFGVIHLSHLTGYGAEDVLSFSSVAARSRMLFFAAVYLILLAAGLYHGFYGLRSLIFELPLNDFLRKAVSVILLVGGCGFFLYGAYAIIAGYAA